MVCGLNPWCQWRRAPRTRPPVTRILFLSPSHQPSVDHHYYWRSIHARPSYMQNPLMSSSGSKVGSATPARPSSPSHSRDHKHKEKKEKKEKHKHHKHHKHGNIPGQVVTSLMRVDHKDRHTDADDDRHVSKRSRHDSLSPPPRR